MLKLNRYTLIIGLLSVFLLLTAAGCGKESTSSDKPEKTGVTLQQEQHRDQEQNAPAPGETPGRQVDGKTGHANEPGNSPGQQTGATARKLISATVTHVVDGDTVEVKLARGREEKVRLIGVDTPESTKEIEPYGKEASAYTKSRLEGRKVWLELDAEERDRYGRLLAYIWLEQPVRDTEAEARDKMFNAELLKEGYAQVMTVPPNVKYADFFVELQREAREAGKGLWGLTTQEKAGKIEDYYVASSRSKKFHRPGCEWGRKIAPDNLVKFKTVDDALNAGYEPCRACNP